MWIFWITWSLLTCTSALLCLTGCVVPAWLKGSVHVSAQSLQTELLLDLGMNTYGMSSRLGLYRRCVYPVYVQAGPDPRAVTTSSSRAKASGSGRVQNSGPRADLIHLRSTCGHYEFALIPHTAWRIGLTLLVLSSIILVFLSFFLLLSGCYLTVLSLVRVQRTCQVLLLIAGTLAFLCCGIYPLGWNQNSEVQQICGQSSSSFRLGKCCTTHTKRKNP
ncbi:hypothetical protein FGIG_01845 [Fasciola gigantica]|uniref:Lipoma HMGIC fusion partner n=1 Tax=Fasciola gigantica TaxID=46835 RepID=A0A504YLQ2_FASGI|nr:hypothetical protein FGIG_01845 [Fasciola gigantica]